MIIPEYVEMIGSSSFNSCDRLYRLTILNPTASLGTYLYSGSEHVVIYCYENSTAHEYVIDNADGSNRSWHRLPEVVNQIPDQVTVIDSQLIYQIPNDTFNLYTSNGGYDYTYVANGMPSGVIFDENTQTFSGVASSIGSSDITVTITESGNSTSDTFTLLVTETNTQPAVANEIQNQTAIIGREFKYTIPKNTFVNVGGYTYSATGMPQGILFNAGTKTFEGIATVGDLYSVTVTLSKDNKSISENFDIMVDEIEEKEEKEYNGFLYEENDDKTFIVINSYMGSETNLTIPDIIDNLPVKEISAEAFKWSENNNSKNLISIKLADSIVKIGSSAFEGCSSLENVNIPVGVTELGVRAFNWCGKLNNIILPNTMQEIKSGTFMNCSNLTNINIPNSITKISNRAFENCDGLTEISIPSNVVTLNSGALKDLSNLEKIYIYNDDIIFQDNDTIKDCSVNLKICANIGSNAENYAVINDITFIDLSLNIDPIEEISILNPTLISKSYNSIAIKSHEGYEYSINNGDSWEESNVFTNLSQNTSYNFIQRIKETDSTLASKNSSMISIKTSRKQSSNSGRSTSTSTSNNTVSESKSISNAKIILANKKGRDEIFIIEQENILVKFNGLSFKGLENKHIQAKIEKISKDELDISNKLKNQIGDLPIFDISIFSDGKKEHFKSDKAIIVEIPVDTELENHKVLAVYIDYDGNSHIMEGVLKDGIMKFITYHLSDYALMYVDKSFDDISTHWSKEATEALSAREIISGKIKTKFAPEDIITKAEFTTLVVRLSNLTTMATTNFSDVSPGMWYTESIAIAKNNNILPPIFGDLFEADKAITREEMMYILHSSLVIRNNSLEDLGKSIENFYDINTISDYALDSVKYLVDRGIISGYNNSINPSATSTRAEVAQMLYNVIKK